MIVRPLAPAPASAWASDARRFPYAFGSRFFVLLALGLPLLAPVWIDSRAIVLTIAWDALVLAIWMVDLRSLPEAAQVRVTRMWPAPLALGVPVHVDLEIENHGTVAIDVAVEDHVHGALRRELAAARVAVEPGAAERTPYEVRPRERGDHAMGVAVLRYRSAWGIAERWATASIGQTVRAYPDLVEARRQSMFLVRGRQTAAEKRRTRSHGLGRDFESLRDYRDGDERRDICWTATARRARLVTRVYQPERSQAVWLVLDAGRLLRARMADGTRLDRMVNAALALTQVALGAGDRVALLAYGRRPLHRLAPDRGPQHLRAVVEALATVSAEAVEANHAAAASIVMSGQKQRSLVVWLTDFAETAGVPDVIESASKLSSRHMVLFAVMRQPELAAVASAVPADPAGMYRGLAAQETLGRRELLLGTLRQRGVLAVELTPDHLTASLVSEYLSVKDRNLV